MNANKPILKVKEWKKQKDWVVYPWTTPEVVTNFKPRQMDFTKAIHVTFTVTK